VTPSSRLNAGISARIAWGIEAFKRKGSGPGMSGCRRRNKRTVERSETDLVIDDIITMVTAARGKCGRPPKNLSPLLYWRVGKRLRDGLRCERSPSRTLEVIECLEDELALKEIKSFTRATFLHTMSFVERFPDYEQIKTLTRNLTWEHYELLINIEDQIKRDFYAWMSYIKHWTSSDLKTQIREDLYKNTPSAQAKKQAKKHKELRDFESVLMRALVSRDERLLSFPEGDES